jgi:hypothetical protein
MDYTEATLPPFADIEAFFEHLQCPPSTFQGQKIAKTLVYEKGLFNTADKQLFTDTVDTVNWRHALKPENTSIAAYSTDDLSYNEMHVLHITFKDDPKLQNKIKGVSSLLHRIIHYPVILVVQQQQQISISLADKLQANNDALFKIDHIYHSGWLKLSQTDGVEGAFLADFTLNNVPLANFYQLYQGLIDKILRLDVSRGTGIYVATSTEKKIEASAEQQHLSIAEKKQSIRELDALRQQLKQLKNTSKIEKQIRIKIALNIKIHSLKKQIKALEQRIF